MRIGAQTGWVDCVANAMLTDIVSPMPPQVSVISGGAGFLGTAIRRALATGGQIICLDRVKPRDDCDWRECNVTDWQAVERVFGEIGRVDRFVHAAGVQSEKFWQMPWHPTVWQETLGVHVLGAALLTQAVLRSKAPHADCGIVNLGSLYGSVAPDFDLYEQEGIPPPAYCAAKAALVGLARWVAVRYGPDGVRCNVVSPSGVDGSIRVGGGFRKRLVERTPSRRLVTAEEVAEAVRFCLEARHLNGVEIVLDGGYCAR